ncbi:YwdI family protein [Oceanobacillus damuensis]|uniref:YwdI family protein n=1 Tax=Oceanobacillus damuensis TaxID=937928 RepID=UPI00082C5AB5|nr:YwdI family protein [Oceanobacillus damuensis]
MAITNERIIKKMIHELYEAKENSQSEEKVVAHIANVRLLCDLFLEEDNTEAVERETEFSAEELKAMIGAQSGSKTAAPKQTTKRTTNHEEANGESIFDF